MPHKLRLLPLLWLAALAVPTFAGGAQPAVVARWGDSLAAFERADRAQRPEAGGVLFVGSSSIRLWPRMPDDFRQVTVINRGFGGSTMADCSQLARQLVVQYRPRHVIVYAGDNDLAEGRTPRQVLESFQEFVRIVRSELPDARISYISVKPSPLREPLLDKAREVNTLVADYIQALPNASFIDVFTAMLDGSGRPRTDLYGPDRLHMNASGYALWKRLITTHILAAQSPSDAPSTGVTPPAR
ncbi:GDSL family lipase [Ramlibacter henchirensis]|uniref:GDSL family lipase n=1 Tax=Ramlibacter henchirensis TaxID=204072 RepID=A0A4Z0C660_9BURK|nr:SGNH/GDSL hydrolase family protein [Ramlibacter henchirensis]TFZ05589.1 GDSL family lipase [Ramlibacter henchirensis]